VVVLVIATAAAAFTLRGWFAVTTQVEVHQKTGAYANAQWDKLKTESAAKLNAQAGWVDEKAGTVHIPISRAVELTLKEIAEAKAKPAPAPAPAAPEPKKKN
jgi:hypothetical protein